MMTAQERPGEYYDEQTGTWKKKIRIRHPGIYGKNFLSKPQPQQYSEIRREEKVESPQEVDEQMSALNSYTYRDSKNIHQSANKDLKYAERFRKGDPPAVSIHTTETRRTRGKEPFTLDLYINKAHDGSGNFQGTVSQGDKAVSVRGTLSKNKVKEIQFHREQIREHPEPNEKPNIQRNRQETRYNEGFTAQGGDKEMVRNANSASDCGSDEEFVAGHPSTYNGRKIYVHAYCRKRTNNDTPRDRQIFSQNGRRNGRKAKDWEDRK